MNCFNCRNYNKNQKRASGIRDSRPCDYRKNQCSDSKLCKWFAFLANVGDRFDTVCHECQQPMMTVMHHFGVYSIWCESCREKDDKERRGIGWKSEWKKCRWCEFFVRIPEQIGEKIEPQGICVIKGDEEDDEPFHPYLSTSFSKRCGCFSFNYENFKTTLHEHERWKNWDKWLLENLIKLTEGEYNMSKYYEIVQTKVPHPETGEAIPVCDNKYCEK